MTRVSRFFVCLFFLLPVAACQAADDKFEAGVHYEVLPQPVPTADPTKVEVVEMFWYGCSHCYNFEPALHDWSKALPEHVQFKALPAIWHPSMELHAQAYYTARALKVLDTMHMRIFEEMNINKSRLDSESAIADLFENNGVNREKFSRVFNSFGVKQSLTLIQSRQRAYRIQGTPEMVVNGKYRISARLTGSQAKMLEVADFLIAKEWAAMQ